MKSPVVVLDPGHGGRAKIGGSSPNNAQGYNGLLERDLTLDLTRRVADAMSRRVMADVRLTRATDANLSLADRAAVARNANAEVFVSIHFNGSTDLAVDGTEAWVATQANAGSKRLAQRLSSGVATVAKVRNRGVKARNLGVLVPSRHAGGTAACLLEVAFLSNRAEADRLTQSKYLDDIALAVAQGIGDTLATPAELPKAQAIVLDSRAAPTPSPTKRYNACLATHLGIAACPAIAPKCIPPRDSNAPTGSEVMAMPGIAGEKEPKSMPVWIAREEALFEQFAAGNIPWFLRRFKKVVLQLPDKNGVEHEVIYFVMPDYLAVGSSSDFVTVPLDAVTAQRVADTYGCVLPTGKMVWDIHQKAKLRINFRRRPYADIVHTKPEVRASVSAEDRAKYGGKDQVSTWAYVEYSDAMRVRIRGKLKERELPAWTLVSGYRKDVVVSKILETDKSRLVFFGAWLPRNTDQDPPKILEGGRGGLTWQSIHHARYADYSHGVRLFSHRVVIDGKDHAIGRVLSDPILGPMLAKEAPFDLASARYI